MEKSARTLDPESFKKRYEAHFPRANSSSENARFLKWCLEQKDIHIWNRWRSLWNEIPSNDENPENHSFKVANLIKVDLAGANLEGADLRRANLVGANLEGADLKWVSLVKANLAGANLEGADLWGADLVGANLTGVNLTGVNLEGVILTEKDLIGVDIEAVAKDPQVERLQGEIKILEEGLRSKDSILKQYRNLQQEFKEKLEESLIESEVKKKLLDSFRSIEEEFNKNEEEKKRDEERKKAESDRTFKVIDEATQELSKTYTATRIKSGFFFCVGVVLIIAAVAFLIRFIDQANSFLGDSAKIKETLVLIDNQPINYLIWVMPKILALGISLILMRFGHTLFTLDRELSSDLEYINRISGALKGTSKINQHYNSMAEVKKVYEKIVEILIIKETPKSEKNAPRENVEKSPLWAEQLTSAIERLTKSTFKPS